jgi:hypothetical protein
MKHLLGILLAYLLSGASRCLAEEVVLTKNAIMHGEHVLASIKAGTTVEIVSRNAQAVTIRHNGQVGSIPPDSVPETKHQEAVIPNVPNSAIVTPAIVFGPLTLFLANSPADSPDELRQYIPDDEHPDRWEHMVSTRVIRGTTDSQAYLMGVQASAKKANPKNRFRLWPGNGESVLELAEYAETPNRPKFAQWSLTRANVTDGENLIVYQYAVRYFGYGDSTIAEMDKERTAMLNPFVAPLSFEEITTILKPHNVKLTVKTDANVESTFPDGSFVYEPKVSLDFAAYIPDGLDIPTGKSQDGRITCYAPLQDILINSEGVGMPFAIPYQTVAGGSGPVAFNRKGAFELHADELFQPHFKLHAGGTYTLKVYCYLNDNAGRRFVVVGTQNVTVVDRRPHD